MATSSHTAPNRHMEATVLKVWAATGKQPPSPSVATVDLATLPRLTPHRLEATAAPKLMLTSRTEETLVTVKRLRHSEALVVMARQTSHLVATVAMVRQLNHMAATDRRPLDTARTQSAPATETRQATLVQAMAPTEAIAVPNTGTAARNTAATVAPARVATVDPKLATAAQAQATVAPAPSTVATAALAVKLATVDLAPQAMAPTPATASKEEDLATVVTIVAVAPATEVTVGSGEERTSADDMKPLALFISSVSFMLDKKMKMI